MRSKSYTSSLASTSRCLHSTSPAQASPTVRLHYLFYSAPLISCVSEGEYISLGYYEKEDVAVVFEHLRQHPLVANIGLWGVSMGAATSLWFSSIRILQLHTPLFFQVCFLFRIYSLLLDSRKTPTGSPVSSPTRPSRSSHASHKTSCTNRKYARTVWVAA